MGTGVVRVALVYIVYIVLRALQGVISKGRDWVALCYFSELHNARPWASYSLLLASGFPLSTKLR